MKPPLKVIIAQTASGPLRTERALACELERALIKNGQSVERYDVPAIPDEASSLSTVASHRLTKLDPWCDVVIALDPIAAVLPHRRKLVWLLSIIGLESADVRPDAASGFLRNVLKAGLTEAEACFAPSEIVEQHLLAVGVAPVHFLTPLATLSTPIRESRPGSEMLVLEPLNDPFSAELMVALLEELPGDFRLRWITHGGDATAISTARRLIAQKRIADRVVIDERWAENSEVVYLLANSAALLVLQQALALVPPAVVSAVLAGVPVIARREAGAPLAVAGVQSVEADGKSFGAAMRAAAGTARRKPRAARPNDWSPLLSELSL